MDQSKITEVPVDQIDLGPRYAIDVHNMQLHLPDILVASMRASIEREGLKFPVLVTSDFKLIDGLRRIEAVHQMGHSKIPAIVAETFDEVIDYLVEVNEGVQVPYHRIGEIILATRPLMMRDASVARANTRWHPRKEPRRYGLAREAYGTAFNQSVSLVNRIKGVYVRAEINGDEEAKELVRQIEAGLITPNTAYGRLFRRPFFKGNVTTRAEQESLLRNTALNLGAVVTGLTKLKTPIKIRPEVAAEHLEELRKARSTLITAIRELEKETGQSA